MSSSEATESDHHTATSHAGNTQPRPIRGWLGFFIPITPAGLTFGPLLMVIAPGSIISYAGALLLGLSLTVLFFLIMRSYTARN